ncbi:MAG: toprim domain-containing protein [Pseudomonadota bacterium]
MCDARGITHVLGGRWSGRAGSAPCPICQPQGRKDQRALSIGTGRDGRVLVKCHKLGCDFLDILATLRDVGAMGDWRPDPVAAAKRAEEERQDRERRISGAQALWERAAPIHGTLAETYLRARQIQGNLSAVRFDPECRHPSRMDLPAMIAPMIREGDGLVAVHRTFLAAPGRKADVDPVKAMLGVATGAAVRLTEGPGPLLVGEGIESTLSAADAICAHKPSAWAAASAHGIRKLALPKDPGLLIIAPDAEAVGISAAEDLAARADDAGWRVRLMPPPDGFNDWNDAARAEGVSA